MKKTLPIISILLCIMMLITGCSHISLPKDLHSNANEILSVYKPRVIKSMTNESGQMISSKYSFSFFTLSLFEEIHEYLPEITYVDTSGQNTTVPNMAKLAILYKSQGKSYYSQLLITMLNLPENNGEGYNLTSAAFSLIASTAMQAEFNEAEVEYKRDTLIDILLSTQTSNGGFSNFEHSDIDTTAMVIQALALHRKIPKVQEAINKAIDFLQGIQDENGGYISTDNAEWFPTPNACSTAQVMIALMSCDINPFTDKRFVKQGNSTYDFLMSLKRDDNYIANTESEKDLVTGDFGYPTEQVLMALGAAVKYSKNGKALYDFT